MVTIINFWPLHCHCHCRYLDKKEKTGIFYPSSPEANYYHVGEGPGLGCNINIPFVADGDNPMTDADYMLLYKNIVLTAAADFNPDLVVIAGGFDAVQGCVGKYKLTPAMFGHMTQVAKLLAEC